MDSGLELEMCKMSLRYLVIDHNKANEFMETQTETQKASTEAGFFLVKDGGIQTAKEFALCWVDMSHAQNTILKWYSKRTEFPFVFVIT